jgi:hypothetical protein
MGEYIHNRPIGCLYCGYGPINGKENKINTRFGIVIECTWTCPKCNQLVRKDESEPLKG